MQFLEIAGSRGVGPQFVDVPVGEDRRRGFIRCVDAHSDGREGKK